MDLSPSQTLLRRAREIAGYTQEELATILGIAQTQVSRYEGDPDSAPYGVVKKWSAACGTTPEQLEAFVAASAEVFNPGEPYKELDGQLNLLEQFVKTAPPVPPGLYLRMQPPELIEQIRKWRQRPTILLAGKFDSAKTRIANTLLGKNYLPSQYAPTTAIITFIRHLSERPSWQHEDVWIMREGFNPSLWGDKEHCAEHKIVGGTYDTLKLYGTRDSEGERQGAYAALVYINAPILRACTIIDTPGFSDTNVKRQADIAINTSVLGDVYIYTSPFNGFLDAQDFLQLSQLLRTLNLPKDTQRPLENLLIVATHTNPSVSPGELEDAIEKRCKSFFHHAKDGIFADIAKSVGGRPIDSEQLRDRMYTFWYESLSRRRNLEAELMKLLTSRLPFLVREHVDEEILNIKADSQNYFANIISSYEKTLQERKEAKEKLIELEAREPERQEKILQQKAKAKRAIDDLRRETVRFVESDITPQLQFENIERFIDSNYGNSEEARKYATAKLLENLQSQLERKIRSQADTFKMVVDEFLSEYEQIATNWGDSGLSQLEIPFDTRGAFLGGLAGLGTLGALGVWAAAMGNLGGYILVAKAAGVLSALGLGVGSTAAVSFVAAIGGPVTIAVGLAAALFVGIKTLFGARWQERLAKRMSKQLEDAQLAANQIKGVTKYWDDTEKFFDNGVANMETKYREYRVYLKQLIDEDLSREDSRSRILWLIHQLQEMQDFFGALPWSSKRQEEAGHKGVLSIKL
jgi:transcriptional regulator with XRE-family HTH domain